MFRMFITGCLAFLLDPAVALENGFEINGTYDAMAKTVEIRWKNNEPGAVRFILQKSYDEKGWINLDTLYNSTDFNQQMILWEDRNPSPGGFLYRLVTEVDEANFSLSKPVYIVVSPFKYSWNSIPTARKGILKLKYSGEGIIGGVINFFIQTPSGRVLLRSRFSSFTDQIEVPVANLGKGTYILSMFVEGDLIWRQKLIK
ncbi:MAG: hypothetical protein IPP31_08295 [Chitinophagaceae bacterium]|nr:hypothetical protein [Chitinophagaceae bacterium]